jgi:hypothetical protein
VAAGRVEPPSAQALARALAGIEAAVAAQEAGRAAGRKKGAVVTAPLRGMSGRRRVLVGLFTAAAVAAGVVTYANTGETPTGTRSEARADTASVFLNDISTVAATQSLSSGKYWKTHLTVGDSYLSQSMDFYGVNGGKAYKKGRQPDWQFGPKDLDWKALDQLTTDPAKLLQLLRTPPRPKSISPFDQAVTLLGGSPASPKLRAGLFKAMAGPTSLCFFGRCAGPRRGRRVLGRGLRRCGVRGVAVRAVHPAACAGSGIRRGDPTSPDQLRIPG